MTSLILGFLAIWFTLPVNILGILSGFSTTCAYLVSKTVTVQYPDNIRVIDSNRKAKINNACIIFLITFIVVMIQYYMGGTLIKYVNIVRVIGNAIGAGVSEVIIFRYFGYSVILNS